MHRFLTARSSLAARRTQPIPSPASAAAAAVTSLLATSRSACVPPHPAHRAALSTYAHRPHLVHSGPLRSAALPAWACRCCAPGLLLSSRRFGSSANSTDDASGPGTNHPELTTVESAISADASAQPDAAVAAAAAAAATANTAAPADVKSVAQLRAELAEVVLREAQLEDAAAELRSQYSSLLQAAAEAEDDLDEADDVQEDLAALLDGSFDEDMGGSERDLAAMWNGEPNGVEGEQALSPHDEQRWAEVFQAVGAELAAESVQVQEAAWEQLPLTDEQRAALASNEAELVVLRKEKARLHKLLASSLGSGSDGAAAAGGAGDNAAASGGQGNDAADSNGGEAPVPASSSSSSDSDPALQAASNDDAELDLRDWGTDEFKPVLFRSPVLPAFTPRGAPSTAAVARMKDVLFVGLSSKYMQLAGPGQPFSVSLPPGLMNAFQVQNVANQIAMKNPNGKPRRMFLGLFFRDDKPLGQARLERKARKGDAEGDEAAPAADATDDAATSAATTAAADGTTSAPAAAAAKPDAEPETSSQPAAAVALSADTKAARADQSLAANGEAPDVDPKSAASTPSALAASSSSLLVTTPAGVQLSGFERVGILAEVVDFIDSNYVLVLCHRRISLSQSASPSPIVSMTPHVRVAIDHHDDLSWQQLRPPSLRYNPDLLAAKNECLRLLRSIRKLEGSKRFDSRLKPYFTFDSNTPGSIIDFWATLCSSTHFPSSIVTPTDRHMMTLVRAVLNSRELLPRIRAVLALLRHEHQLVLTQKDIEASTTRMLAERHQQMLAEQKKEVEQSLHKATLDAQQQAAKMNGTPGPKTATADAGADGEGASATGTKTATPDNRTDKERLLDKFTTRMAALQSVPVEASQAMEDELEKLRGMDSESSFEYSATRNYLDWLTSLPWGRTSPEKYDIRHAERVLAKDHYGLDDVKTRILEFVATGRLLGQIPQGKIICLVGPPGVGKTSIGKSIAAALSRQFYRFSVGGLEDVSEIKGHRRTYVGALPGKLVQALKRTDCANPVILIDEIDKLGRSARGDPSSALLEVLDPEQNNAFNDHYLDVPLDLSKVLFICTANERENIPGPLADRMDFIELSGYMAAEKVSIATNYLEPAIRERTGVTAAELQIQPDALFHLIRWYCREAGVRSLQKYLERIYRKVALLLARNKKRAAVDAAADAAAAPTADAAAAPAPASTDAETVATIRSTKSSAEIDAAAALSSLPLVITPANLKTYAGPPNYLSDKLYEVNPVGVSTGLAYSSHGGAVLFIESAVADATSDPRLHVGAAAHAVAHPGEEPAARREDELDDEQDENGEEGEDEDAHTRANPAKPWSPSRGDLFCTGQMGSVMKESSSIAYTVAKRIVAQRTAPHSPARAFFDRHRIHLHLPAGATPKDGPSAGIAMTTSLLSLALDTAPVAAHAMTGELTLTGKVLPIGGVKEKLMAAKHANIRLVVLPAENRKDVEELKEYVTEGLEIHYATTYDDVFKLIFPHWTETASSLPSLPLLSSLQGRAPTPLASSV